ncbi:MAG: energy transducer TonB [Halioglobus sp.]|jgi:protein TonB|uniref:energy transducer TonB n=1 Tax=Halioglobus sp. Uisw_031 TaxID=3230977 RepID=UPI0035917A2A|tara:strand:+ start:894 stop:1496 length:603 start_codon:yes stop_codon:yes gene_type:complete
MESSLFRTAISILLAIVVVVALFLIMRTLIDGNFVNPEVDDRMVAELVRLPDDIELQNSTPKPDKAEDPEEPPPDMEMEQLDVNMDVDIENVAPRANINISIGTGTMAQGDGEYLPIVKVAPIYPRRAQTRGISGYCIVEYTVTTSGAIRDPRAVDCQPSGVFDKASVKASLKFKYKPRVVDGEPIEVAGVRNKFTYELE